MNRLNRVDCYTSLYIGNGFCIVLTPKSVNIEIRYQTGRVVKPGHTIKTVKPLALARLKLGCGGFSTHFQLTTHFQAETHMKSIQISQDFSDFNSDFKPSS